MKYLLSFFVAICLVGIFVLNKSVASSDQWKREWPNTDFSKSTIDFDTVISGGPPKDGIPSIDNPKFRAVSKIEDLDAREPVISLAIGEKAKAYPLRILIWHEIVNDTVNGVPVIVTYCPLCNSSVAFRREVDGKVLEFGVSGKLRHSDMIMYDRQTQSWWQQFTGVGIVGEMTGKMLERLPARVVPFSRFKDKHPDGQVLVPDNRYARDYGKNPYVNYDSSKTPFLYREEYTGPGDPMSYVIAVEDEAFFMNALRKKGRMKHDNLVLTWQGGMNSALDAGRIKSGRDIGFIQVQRKQDDGSLKDIPYDTTFAFAFKAFHPDGKIYGSQ